MRLRRVWWVGLVLLGGSLAGATGSAGKQRVERLEREARALANPKGCEKVEECELVGLGLKSCGGPRTHVAYCSRTTDGAALKARLQALEEAERAWQREDSQASNCGLTRVPRLRWEGGECRAR